MRRARSAFIIASLAGALAPAAWTPTAALAQTGTSPPATESQETPEAVAERYRLALTEADWTGAAALVHPDDLADFREVVDTMATFDEGPELLAEWYDEPAQLETLTDAQVLAGYLRWLVAGEPGALEMMRSMTWTVRDVHVDGDRSVVVAEVSLPGGDVAEPMADTTPMRLHAGEWRIDLSAAVAALREGMGLAGGASEAE